MRSVEPISIIENFDFSIFVIAEYLKGIYDKRSCKTSKR